MASQLALPDDILLSIFMLLGGVGLFLLGMESLVRMFQEATGPVMRRAIARVGDRQWKGWLTGTGTSALIHSAPAVVILMGLTSAGLLRFGSSMGMIAGANFGTTLAIQIIAFDIGRYALGLIGAGMLAKIVWRSQTGGHVSLGLVGFGLIFLGLTTLKSSMTPFQDAPWLQEAVATLGGDNPLGVPLGIAFGCLVTIVLQSSGAAISILFSLGALGLLPDLGAMIPMLLGIQLGKCMPTVLAAVGNTAESLQVVLAHVTFNVLAIVVGLATLPLVERHASAIPGDAMRQIANYNSILMLVTGIVLIPLSGWGARLIEKATARSERPRSTPSHLDPDLIPYPEQALAACVDELRREGRYTSEMLDRALDGLVSLDARAFATIKRLEACVDVIRREVEDYLQLIGGRRLSPRQILMLQHVARMTNALKRVGDHIDGLVDLSREKFRKEVWFDDEDMGCLLELSLRTRDMLSATLDSLDPDHPDPNGAARKILKQRSAYRKASRAIRDSFNESLPEDGGEGRTAVMYNHYVTIFDKIVSHVKEIARQEKNWSWQLKEHKFAIREPEAEPSSRVPRSAKIDPDYEAAITRMLAGGFAQKPTRRRGSIKGEGGSK